MLQDFHKHRLQPVDCWDCCGECRRPGKSGGVVALWTLALLCAELQLRVWAWVQASGQALGQALGTANAGTSRRPIGRRSS
mmetsp:Transcript_13769/g.25601  ORF Transcript_13769/g.25601 Transcript_13769/m.25601 type:complete len:81 (-) Transcript_13769:123-365(-)